MGCHAHGEATKALSSDYNSADDNFSIKDMHALGSQEKHAQFQLDSLSLWYHFLELLFDLIVS